MTPVNIGRITSAIRTMEGGGSIPPQTVQQIVELVLQAVEDNDNHRQQLRRERRVTPGVAYELDEED